MLLPLGAVSAPATSAAPPDGENLPGDRGRPAASQTLMQMYLISR